MIYASVRHITKFTQTGTQEPAVGRLIQVTKPISPRLEEITLKGAFTNYIENERENKRIGDLGELLVLQHEQEKLKTYGIRKHALHKSKTEGDGLGYNIFSYDKHGNEIFIEVKTTMNDWNTPFFITANEYKLSILERHKFFLYRLYDFEDRIGSAKYLPYSAISRICATIQ